LNFLENKLFEDKWRNIMNKFCLITVIWGTICITIVGGCGVKTVDTKNVNQEMEKSKKEPILDKKSAKEETIKPPIQKSSPDKKLPSDFVEESITSENNMEIQEVTPSKEQFNPFFDPNYNDKVQKDANKKIILSENLNDVYFSFDQYEIDESEKNILLKNAEWLKHNPSLKVQLAGHCDERGTNNYNIALGDKRALYVKKQLAFLGINESRLFPISYGEEKPICWEGKEKCWSKNRRVQFLIISD
jgi:peptidoglycan-associated lipoprotein